MKNLIQMAGLRPHKCPVCEGRGTVPSGFYSGGRYTGNTHRQECRTCKGKGIVWPT